jgi:hypothetical protein
MNGGRSAKILLANTDTKDRGIWHGKERREGGRMAAVKGASGSSKEEKELEVAMEDIDWGCGLCWVQQACK